MKYLSHLGSDLGNLIWEKVGGRTEPRFRSVLGGGLVWVGKGVVDLFLEAVEKRLDKEEGFLNHLAGGEVVAVL